MLTTCLRYANVQSGRCTAAPAYPSQQVIAGAHAGGQGAHLQGPSFLHLGKVRKHGGPGNRDGMCMHATVCQQCCSGQGFYFVVHSKLVAAILIHTTRLAAQATAPEDADHDLFVQMRQGCTLVKPQSACPTAVEVRSASPTNMQLLGPFNSCNAGNT